MEEYQEELLSLLKNKITPATGCTEPIAVAYAVAKAREKSEGKISKLQIQVDSNIYKNGLMVTIPGTKERGLLAAAAFGFLFGKTEKGFRVIEGLNDDNIREAKQLILQNKIKVVLNREYKGLQIEVELETDKEKVRVITSDSHLNIVSIEKISKEKNFKPFKKENNKNNNSNEKIQQYVLEDFLQFSKNTPLNNLKFLVDGVNMNLEIAREGL
ncbi:MAG: serine dehydratase subunit alpha family protein, partial [Atribacterota bacterium]|nr:serine dehydratase subunit alpha family protein [Atribacterota bacterium]